MAEMPAYGTEKYTLVSGGVGDQLQPHRIEHRIWTETGRTTFFDEKAKDFPHCSQEPQRTEPNKEETR
jgi:hypothetical protein